MKELTKKQKLDFILYCMEQIDTYWDEFFTCNYMDDFFNIRYSGHQIDNLFPEMRKYSASSVAFHLFGGEGKGDNKTRAIIYSFLYNELTGEIKI